MLHEVHEDESQRLEHIEDILHRNEEPVSRDHKEIGKGVSRRIQQEFSGLPRDSKIC